jgi:hypothetical protein
MYDPLFVLLTQNKDKKSVLNIKVIANGKNKSNKQKLYIQE